MKHVRMAHMEDCHDVALSLQSTCLGGVGVEAMMAAARSATERMSMGPGLDQMADGIARYWFVAAVFRDPKDLAETVAEMRASGFNERICVVANHALSSADPVGDGDGADRMMVVALDADGAIEYRETLDEPGGMRVLLQCMDGKMDGASSTGVARPHIYAQLQEDVRDGAFVLLAAVDGPDEQVIGARLLLKGNCECVLTHEIEAPTASS